MKCSHEKRTMGIDWSIPKMCRCFLDLLPSVGDDLSGAVLSPSALHARCPRELPPGRSHGSAGSRPSCAISPRQFTPIPFPSGGEPSFLQVVGKQGVFRGAGVVRNPFSKGHRLQTGGFPPALLFALSDLFRAFSRRVWSCYRLSSGCKRTSDNNLIILSESTSSANSSV